MNAIPGGDSAGDRGAEVTRVSGVVISGEQRGRVLGFPTANLQLCEGAALPAFGVYAGIACGRPAAVSVGVRPTFGDALEPLVEVHILDFDGDLYGRELSVDLVQYLRPERRFDTLERLRDQIAADVTAARACVSP